MIQCTKCRQWKGLENFTRNKRNSSGYATTCKQCRKEYREKTKEHINQYNKTYQKNNLDKFKTQNKRYRIKKKSLDHDYDKRRAYKTQYNLSLEDVIRLFTNGCVICGAKEGKLCVDHCHATGKIRGCLCSKCNLMLGYSQDSTKTLLSAIEYLNKNKTF
jgi:hypothetical protein